MLEVVIGSVAEAFKEFKSLCSDGLRDDGRGAAGLAFKELLERRMANAADGNSEEMRVRDVADGGGDGHYSRHLC